jgi:hypothetical protein
MQRASFQAAVPPAHNLVMENYIGSESENSWSTTRPSYSERTDTTFEAVDLMDRRSDTYTYDPNMNIHVYDPSMNIHVYDPSMNIHVYEPSVNVHAYEPSVNVHVYEPSVDVHAYEPSVSIYDDQPSLDECSVPGRAFTSYQDNEGETSNQFAQQQHLAGKF